jgi:hypothetical protein
VFIWYIISDFGIMNQNKLATLIFLSDVAISGIACREFSEAEKTGPKVL